MDAETQALLRAFAKEEGAKLDLPSEYVDAVLHVESSGGRDVTSPAGARGPMQLMPATAKRLGVNIDDPIENVRGGLRELASLRDRFGGDLVKAYAGYNSNPDLVEERLAQGGFDGLPAETRTALVRLFERAPHLLDPPAAAPAVQPVAAPVPQPAWRRVTDVTSPVEQAPTFSERLAASPVLRTRDWADTSFGERAELLGTALLPAGATAIRSGLIAGGFGAFTAARQAIGRYLSPDSGLADVPEAIASMDGNDLASIGVAAATGSLLGAATHKMAGALTGPRPVVPDPPPPPPRPALRAFPEVPESLPAPKPPRPQALPPAPRPQLPTDEEIALLTAREAQSDAQRAAAARLRVPADAADAGAQARALLPQPNKPEVDAAYAALRNARGEAPVNVTGIRARLREAGINPGELGLGGEHFEAPLQETLDALSRVNQQKFRTLTQSGGGGFRGGELRILSAQLYEDVAKQLTPPQQALLAKATDVARTNGQLRRLQELVDATQTAGIPQGRRGLDRLLNKPTYWRTKLGDDIYEYAVHWFRDVAKLQESPLGERVVATVARETSAYREALAAHGARTADIARRNAEAAQAYADKLTALEAKNAQRLGRYRARVDERTARNQEAMRRYDERAARAQAEYAERVAAIEPPGASQFVRSLVQAPFGAAAGAASAYAIGVSPTYGALAGAVGFGAPTQLTAPLLDPVFGRAFRALATHPEGTQQWFQAAGRLALLAGVHRDALMPTPAPAPLPTPTPLPLGRVAAR